VQIAVLSAYGAGVRRIRLEQAHVLLRDTLWWWTAGLAVGIFLAGLIVWFGMGDSLLWLLVIVFVSIPIVAFGMFLRGIWDGWRETDDNPS
jgi:ABC-type nitrate/sulfonate/bicarbonate transport system permease component